VRQTSPVTSAELRREASARGVATSYAGAEIADATLAAVLAAMGDPAPAPGAGLPPYPGAAPPPALAPFPARRSWGFTLQLYSLRSRDSWGHGDLHDLADFATWSADDLGADFVLINPLHAAEPLPPVSDSPYLPMSRRFVSPLYLRIEDIPEIQQLDPQERARLLLTGKPLREASGTASLIDRDAVWTAKRAALEVLYRVPLPPRREAELDAFRVREGVALTDWATWCALAERHGPDWRQWPAALADPRSAEVAAARAELSGLVAFHVWVQWQTEQQVESAQRAARDAGMSIGIVHDLAVGVHPGGADAWSRQDVIVRGVSVGAPPDEFNQRGQDWTLPPWHPERLRAARYQPLADLFSESMDGTGGLRVDHVMGLSRLWWIPDGMSPAQGTYVYYDHEATVGALCGLAAQAGTLAIGEDLGTVEPWLRDFLAARQVLGTSMLWFERADDGSPLPPKLWRRASLATVSTHDMPPAAAFLTGEQVTERARLGLLTRPEAAERADAASTVRSWLTALAREGLLPAGTYPSPEEFTVALYAYLAKTPAMLIGVSLAEAVGERRSQNVPGTTDQYPNWRLPLCDASGSPVLLEDLRDLPSVGAVARAAAPHPPNPTRTTRLTPPPA
jgi:4-alpha-glucanotransferase